MKIIGLLVFTIISFSSFGQTDYLKAYGQAWGFLKYFHPYPSETDWDEVLLKDFEQLNKSTTQEEFNSIIDELIQRCGDYKAENRNLSEQLIFSSTFSWIETSAFSDQHQEYFKELQAHKPIFQNKYIIETQVGKPQISEKTYDSIYKYSPSLQYLALTRYWNFINYYYTNRNIIPKDWDLVYHEFIPQFLTAKTSDEYYLAIAKLNTELRDGHGIVLYKNKPLLPSKRLPFSLFSSSDGVHISRIYNDSLNTYNLHKFDEILEIDELPIHQAIAELGNRFPTSNDYTLSKFAYLLTFTEKDSVELKLKRGNEILHLRIASISLGEYRKRLKHHFQTSIAPPYEMRVDSISGKEYLYVNMGILERTDINKEFSKQLKRSDYLVLDARNYPNWTVLKLSKELLGEKTYFAKILKSNFDYPGAFEWKYSQEIGKNRKPFNGKILVLVDAVTQSQAEYTVMAFQEHPNTTVIGGQTAGADGNVSSFPFPFDVVVKFSGLSIFYMDGTPTQQVGIRRDVEVVQSLEYLKGNDLILERALQLIRAAE